MSSLQRLSPLCPLATQRLCNLLELPLVKSCSAHVSTIWFLVAPKFQSYTKVFRPIFELIFVHNGRKESSLSLPQVDFSGGGAQL